jgi:hypothetical protein
MRIIEKSLLLVLVTIFLFIGCRYTGAELMGRPQSSPEQASISSISDTTKCAFIKSAYVETQPHTLNYYLKKNVYNAGGDSYKIISSNTQMVSGINIMMTNFEIYKCK